MSSPSESSAPADDIVVERHVTESNSGAGGGGGAGAGAGAGAGSGSAESKTAGKMSAPAGKDDTPFQVVHDQEAILNFIFSGDRGGFIGVNEKRELCLGGACGGCAYVACARFQPKTAHLHPKRQIALVDAKVCFCCGACLGWTRCR